MYSYMNSGDLSAHGCLKSSVGRFPLHTIIEHLDEGKADSLDSSISEEEVGRWYLSHARAVNE